MIPGVCPDEPPVLGLRSVAVMPCEYFLLRESGARGLEGADSRRGEGGRCGLGSWSSRMSFRDACRREFLETWRFQGKVNHCSLVVPPHSR